MESEGVMREKCCVKRKERKQNVNKRDGRPKRERGRYFARCVVGNGWGSWEACETHKNLTLSLLFFFFFFFTLTGTLQGLHSGSQI